MPRTYNSFGSNGHGWLLRIDMSGISIDASARLLAAALLLQASAAAAQVPVLPRMECGSVQANLHIRCTAIGVAVLTRDRDALWTDVPAKELLDERYIDESECHAHTEARCEQISNLPSSYARLWAFEQVLGSKGCVAGATGNGWIDPYLAWRAKVVLPRRAREGTWLLTIAVSTLTAGTIRAYPNAATAISPCQFSITGIGTSKSIPIPRAQSLNQHRETLSRLSPGEYLAELRCPAIQGSECQQGKASVSVQLTASPFDR